MCHIAIASYAIDQPVAVDGGACVCHAEFGDIAHSEVCLRADREKAVLIVELGNNRPLRGRRQHVSVAVKAQQHREALVEGCIAHAKPADCQPRLWPRQHFCS